MEVLPTFLAMLQRNHSVTEDDFFVKNMHDLIMYLTSVRRTWLLKAHHSNIHDYFSNTINVTLHRKYPPLASGTLFVSTQKIMDKGGSQVKFPGFVTHKHDARLKTRTSTVCDGGLVVDEYQLNGQEEDDAFRLFHVRMSKKRQKLSVPKAGAGSVEDLSDTSYASSPSHPSSPAPLQTLYNHLQLSQYDHLNPLKRKRRVSLPVISYTRNADDATNGTMNLYALANRITPFTYTSSGSGDFQSAPVSGTAMQESRPSTPGTPSLPSSRNLKFLLNDPMPSDDSPSSPSREPVSSPKPPLNSSSSSGLLPSASGSLSTLSHEAQQQQQDRKSVV